MLIACFLPPSIHSVIHEQIVCPEDAGATVTEMRAWIAEAAGGALKHELGAQRAAELRAPGFPFNHGVEVEWD